MREVHPGNVHPILNQFQETLRRPADRSNGADNTREPHLVGSGVHVEVGAGLAGFLLASWDVHLLQNRRDKLTGFVLCWPNHLCCYSVKCSGKAVNKFKARAEEAAAEDS